MSDLDAIIARVAGLSSKDQAQLTSHTMEATKALKWVPNPGAQTAAYFSKADVLLYGGEPGGGKSQLCIGLAFNEHQRSVIMRRQYGDLDRIVEDALKVHGSRAGFNGSPPPKLKVSDTQIIDFAAANRVGDEQGQMGKGRDLICVERGTMVVMGDDSHRAIESLAVGDVVMTLEGPKPVTRILPVRRDLGAAVSIERDGVIYFQVQSRSHSLLTTGGWVSYDKLCESHPSYFSSPTPLHASCKTSKQSGLISLPSFLHRGRKALDRLRCEVQILSRLGHQGLRATYAYISQLAQGSACVASYASSPEQSPHSLSSVRVTLPRPLRQMAGLKRFFQSQALHDVCDVRASSSLQDSIDHYLCGSGPCGEPPRLVTHLCSSPVAGLAYPPQPNDAERQSPIGFAADALDKTPRYTSHIEWYCHPYTKEIRQIHASVSDCSFSMIPVGEVDLHDIEVLESNHYITVGGFVNKNCFDEATHFAESQIRFVMGWNRTEDPNQRCRVVLATNPPLAAEGLWVLSMFAPWLDPQYPNPAKHGELRWVISDEDGKDLWVDGPDDYREIKGKIIKPTSRTYIPASVKDNPYYVASGYEQQLDAMPEPYRSLLMGGFKTAFKDLPNQIIPTKWVQLAQQRWKPKPPDDIPMCCIGVDASGGGDDPMVLARRYDGWFDELIRVPGKEIPMERAGAHCGGIVVSYRRNNSLVVIDMGGGYGGPMYEHLHGNSVEVKAYKGAEKSNRRSADGKLHFTNKRTSAYWGMREALDPGQPGGSPIALPPDQQLLADLTAPTFEITPNGIKAEPKEEVCKRLGRSTDAGDSVVMSWHEGPREITDAMEWMDNRELNRPMNRRATVVLGGRTPLTARK